jgi:hypothetical protein
LVFKFAVYKIKEEFIFTINGRKTEIIINKDKIDKRKINFLKLLDTQIEDLKISIRYGNENPQKVAVRVSAIRELLGQISSILRVKESDVSIVPDFELQDFIVDTSILLKMSSAQIISLVFSILTPNKKGEKVYG